MKPVIFGFCGFSSPVKIRTYKYKYEKSTRIQSKHPTSFLAKVGDLIVRITQIAALVRKGTIQGKGETCARLRNREIHLKL